MLSAELELLLALNGNKRIVHLEEEIFANNELRVTYLDALNNGNWYGEEKTIDGQAWVAYRYAVETIGARWLQAEQIIKFNGMAACYYATNAMRSRWLEAEDIILANKEWSKGYIDRYMSNDT